MSLVEICAQVHSYDKKVPHTVSILTNTNDINLSAYGFNMDIDNEIFSGKQYSIVSHPNLEVVFREELFRRYGMSCCVTENIDVFKYNDTYILFKPRKGVPGVYAVAHCDWLTNEISTNVIHSIFLDYKIIK